MGLPFGSIPGYVDHIIMKDKRATGAMQSLVHTANVLNPAISSKLHWSISVTFMLYGVEILELNHVDFGMCEAAYQQMARNLFFFSSFFLDPHMVFIMSKFLKEIMRVFQDLLQDLQCWEC